ncbi:MAG: HAMP domain-containing histidine kinase [Chloroflexi bacterium]|nr:HAMP domain-containing histidine kinase [Chloroflexota bacterium]
MLQSIRWRLPLSYAGIALLATLALGTVLLTTLRGYYTQREREYLNRNAEAFSRNIEQFAADGVALKDMQYVLDNHSFIARSRVRLLDSDSKTVLDTGTFTGGDLITIRMESVPTDAVFGSAGGSNSNVVISQGATDVGPVQNTEPIQGPMPAPTYISFFSASGIPAEANLSYWDSISSRPPEIRGRSRSFSLPVGGSPFGYDSDNPDISKNGQHSNEKIIKALYDQDGTLIGYLEVSEGPAFGREIVDSVAQGLISAGAVAIILAAFVGWLISRNISQPLLILTEATSHMADGRLSARVDLKRKDELGVLAHSFNEMAHRVENTVVTLRRFVADAAHELHTPLTALRTNLELAVSETNPHARENFIHRAEAQANRLEHLTNSLLDLARIESGSYQHQAQSVDLTGLMKQINEAYASRAEQAGLTLAIETPKHDIIIEANEPQITRVIDNLLDNALKFTPEDGAITLGLTPQEHDVELWVKDTGIGIPQEDLPNLFNRFYRGHNVAAYPGNGLGLVIIKAIVEEHRGSVSVQSDPSGTCFSVRLPKGAIS